MARISVTLPADLIARIDELVGKQERSQFIAEAAATELKRRRRVEVADLVAGSLRDADTPPEWKTSEGAAAWVRSIRQSPVHWAEHHVNVRDRQSQDE